MSVTQQLLAIAAQTARALSRAARDPGLLALLALGELNLLGGAIQDAANGVLPTTTAALALIDANFAPVLWLVAVYSASRSVDVAGSASAVVRAASALCAAAGATMAFAGVAALTVAGWQLARGGVEVDLLRYAHRISFNLGWGLLHVSALAVFAHCAAAAFGLGARLCSAFTIGAALGVELLPAIGIDHVLLSFGAPATAWSEMNGYGHQLYAQVALGIFWTAFCAVLMIAAALLLGVSAGRRRALLVAAWPPTVVALVSGGWIVLNAEPGSTGVAPPDTARTHPQPVLTRLRVEIDIHPLASAVATRGTAIVANPHAAPIPELRVPVAGQLSTARIESTGELVERTAWGLVYRLNRPLAPKETLRVDFETTWRSARIQSAPSDSGLVANGTRLRLDDVLPNFAVPPPTSAESEAAPVPLALRASTALGQTVVAPGTLARRWREEGRSYFEYQTRLAAGAPVQIFSARYRMASAEHQGVVIEVYHHPGHERLAASALAQARRLVDEPSAEGRDAGLPAVWRIAEYADHQGVVRGPRLLGFGTRAEQWLAGPPQSASAVSERASHWRW